MRKDGFTLVELLAVIVIIALIGIITLPIVDRIIKDGKTNARITNYDTILNAAYDFVQNEPERLPSLSSPSEILFEELVNEGLLKSDMIDPDTKGPYPNNSKVTIKYYESYSGEISENSKFFGNYLFSYIK